MGYNEIILHGGQTCDYLHISHEKPEGEKSVFSEPAGWDDKTLLFSKFDSSLSAGNNDLEAGLSGYEVRRRKGASAYTEYVGKITDPDRRFIVDYTAVNNTEYTYYLYPISSVGTRTVLLSPQLSDDIKPDWSYWSLMVVEETSEDNVFYLDKLFKFELNLSVDDMNNNAQISVTHNFTKYPTIQLSPSNFWSGGLTSLCGYVSCSDADYIQTPNMINELKELTTDTRRKFLKDMDGNIYEVKITSPINISVIDNNLQSVKSVKISWTEVGKTDGISIINNPELATTTWLLTDTGIAVPYMSYVWEDGHIWDNSKRWTGKNDILNTDISNIGRDLFSEDGDKDA